MIPLGSLSYEYYTKINIKNTFFITKFIINSLTFWHVISRNISLSQKHISHINNFINRKCLFNINYSILFTGKIFRINNDPLIIMCAASVFQEIIKPFIICFGQIASNSLSKPCWYSLR